VILLWHGKQPIGICIFSAPQAAISLRNRFFGLKGAYRSHQLAQLNRKLWVLSRVVLHPTYRGAGLGAGFVRAACQHCEIPWIETLSALGRIHPFFERAGFQFVGIIRKKLDHHEFSEPGYWILRNRDHIPSPSDLIP
jgi:GNAT superfamily N-acetyltransferase